MRQAISKSIQKLFDEYPFSKKAELERVRVEKAALQEYDSEVNSGVKEQKAVGNILQNCGSFIELCTYLGINTVEDVENDNTQKQLCGKSQFKKLFLRIRRYIYVECILYTLIFNIILVTVCKFGIANLLMALILTIIDIGLLHLVKAKERRTRSEFRLAERKYDRLATEEIKSRYDLYSKKLINSVYMAISVLFYVLFSTILSAMRSKYNIADIMQEISMSSTVIQLSLYLFFKNLKCRRYVREFFVDEKEKMFLKEIRRICIFSTIYYVSIMSLLLYGSEYINFIFNVVAVVIGVYCVIGLIYNITRRSALTFVNINVNKKKIAVYTMVAILAVVHSTMSMDTYLTQPYIDTIAGISHNEDRIEYDEDTGVYTITAEKDEFRILQLTDIHLGGSVMSISKDIKALDACYELIAYTKPDLVIVTGDLVFPLGIASFSLNNKAPIMQFAAFMRNVGIPWAFTYGNHDTEEMATTDVKAFDELMRTLSYKNSENLLYPYIQPDIYGRSNQMIKICNRDGKLMQAIFLLDSNDYISGQWKINQYDYIHDDQVEWYKKNVEKLCDSAGYTVPSMVFFHMPLVEYKDANDLYEQGSDEVKYYYGKIGEHAIDRICCSKYRSKLFDTALELGSTKAMFCGHDHYNNLSVEYKGIRLTYGYSIDYLVMPGIEDDVEQRGGTLIKLSKYGDYEIEPYKLKDIQGKKTIRKFFEKNK